MNNLLRNLDFASYRDLLCELLPPGSLCAVSDAGGATRYADEGFPEAAPATFLSAAATDWTAAAPELVEVRRIQCPHGALYAAPLLVDASGKPGACLWVLAPARDEVHRITGALSAVAAIVARDLKLHAELDDMASELAERYEELNLVYHTEDQVSYFVEGQQALSNLVRNCCDYLNVGLAVLVMREKGMTVSYESADWSKVDGALLVESIRSRVYDKVVEDKDALVINDASSREARALWHVEGHRLLAAPVLDGKGEVNGILALVNNSDRPRFSNSDKNLLRVMARKAAKIVQVSYDLVTGLVNRDGFEFFAQNRLADAENRGAEHCVLHFDIDQLHVINDTISHDAGDAVIRSVAALLRGGVRDSDVVARLGGDEFGILLANCSLERATAAADKLRESVMNLVIPWVDRSLTATVSVGVAPLDAETKSVAVGIAAAELARDAAKELGKNRVHCYQHSDTGLIKRHHDMDAVGKIRTALDEDRFELYAQLIEPIAAPIPAGGRHLEVLLRMRDDDDEPLPPAAFLPAAERYHLMPEIDRWVVTKTVAFLNEHRGRLGAELEMIAINLSGQTLGEPGFMEFLNASLSSLALPLERICFEITETAAVSDLAAARKFIRELRERGCHFALDDFGSGLSSFGYLRSLPVDYLKIDGSIVKEIDKDPIAASMVAAVQQVAQVMGLKTIAEFVENESIRSMLKRMGVSFAQGYAVAKPRPLAEYVAGCVDRREAVSK